LGVGRYIKKKESELKERIKERPQSSNRPRPFVSSFGLKGVFWIKSLGADETEGESYLKAVFCSDIPEVFIGNVFIINRRHRLKFINKKIIKLIVLIKKTSPFTKS
jgi:hypothetical protein